MMSMCLILGTILFCLQILQLIRATPTPTPSSLFLDEPLPLPDHFTGSSSRHEPLEFIKRESPNDTTSIYYYSSITSLNFPSEFVTPFTKFYVINISSLLPHLPPNPVLNIYLTELLTHEECFNLYDGGGQPRPLGQDVKQIPMQLGPDEVAELQVYIPNLMNQFRTKLHFHDLFGYNLTLEVVDGGSEKGGESQSCSLRNCSYAGRCKATPGERRLEFRCECLEGYSGPFCQYGPECDPRRNINFCQNGGTCRMFGYAGGKCDCPPGFGGSKCQLKKRTRNFVTTNRDCEISNGFTVEDRPCSLCNTFPDKPESWHRFLLIVESTMVTTKSRFYVPSKINLTQGSWNVSQHLSQYFEDFLLGREWVEGSNRTIVEVFGQLLLESEDQNKSSSSSNSPMTSIRLSKRTFPLGLSVTLRPAPPISHLSLNQSGILEPSIWMNKEKEKPLLVGTEFSLTCRSRRPTPSSLIQFRWYKDHVLIRKEYTARNRRISQFPLEPGGGDEVWSFLMIDNVSPFDMGVFTCQVTDLISNVQECADYTMLVVVPPQIEVMPMSVTMVKNDSKILMCSDSLEALSSQSHDNLVISWYKDGEPIRSSPYGEYSIEGIFPQGQLLRLRAARSSATFTCRARNKGGVDERSVRVEVMDRFAPPSAFCPRSCEVVEGTGSSRLTWGLTALHSTALILCPRHFLGYVQRKCGSGGENGLPKWEPSDFSRCSHQELGRFNFTLRSNQNGYRVRSDGLGSLHKQLNAYLNGRKGGNGDGGSGEGLVGVVTGRDSLLNGEGDKFIRMLEDVFAYVRALNRSSPWLVGEETILGLVSVVDNFMTFRNSCAHPSAIDHLLHQFFSFLKLFRVEGYSSRHIFIQRLPLPLSFSNESSPVVINATSTQLTFDCNALIPLVEGDLDLDLNPGALVDDPDEVERFLTFTEISGLSQLNSNVSILSAVVRVDLSPGVDESQTCVKDDAVFHLLFRPLDLRLGLGGNKTCGRMDGVTWGHEGCTLASPTNSTTMEEADEGILCICKVNLLRETEAYALLGIEESPPLPPKVSELIQLPPEWIAASGSVVCIVLVSRTLVAGLIRRHFQPHFLLVSSGLIVTSLSLLHIILMNYCRAMGLAYMSLTLGIQAVRIWRMLGVADLGVLHPWLEQVSPWIILTALTFSQIGPLLTVFLLDSDPNHDHTPSRMTSFSADSVLDQHSAVFITFAALVALSVLVILILFYKTHLRFHRKASTVAATNSNAHHGDRQALNETLFQTLVHLVQILSLVLYLNMKRHIFFHYLFAIATMILGLSWRLSKQTQKRGNHNPTGGCGGDSSQPLPSHLTNGNGHHHPGSRSRSTTTLLQPPQPPFHAFKPTKSMSNGSSSTGTGGSSRDHQRRHLQYKLELKPLTLAKRETHRQPRPQPPPPSYFPPAPKPLRPRAPTTLEDDEDEDPITFDTRASVSTISQGQGPGQNHTHLPTPSTSASTSGIGYLRPYVGALPKRAECHLLLDEGYVLPSLQAPLTNKS